MEKLRKLPNQVEPYLFISSETLNEDIDLIKSENLRNIALHGFQEYKLNHIDWFELIGAQIESLILTPPRKNDFSFSGLKYCTNLKRVTINNETNDVIDLTNNTEIENLSLLNYKPVIGLENLSKLENLNLTNKTPPKLLTREVFDRFSHLKSLSLQGVKLSSDLAFLDKTPLENLIFFNCKNVSLKGLLALNITSLDIDRCKNIDNEELIYELHSLKVLKLIDSIVVENTQKFERLENLETLVVTGTSYFIDGNLDGMKNKLKHFSFDDKKHYNVKYDEFKKSYLL